MERFLFVPTTLLVTCLERWQAICVFGYLDNKLDHRLFKMVGAHSYKIVLLCFLLMEANSTF